MAAETNLMPETSKLTVPPAPGQESVWQYPRPPRLERVDTSIEIVLAGQIIVNALWCFRVLETSHPPNYYIHPEFIRSDAMIGVAGSSHCEWKGTARYFDVTAGDRTAHRAAWGYDRPSPGYEPLAGCVAFYARPMDRCSVNGEVVLPQPGAFYGGWITASIVGPFKGELGTMGW